MFKYGFELEGFYRNGEVPPATYPVDGFPGLVELRTEGGNPSCVYALMQLAAMAAEYTPSVNFTQWQHTFTPAQKQELRTRQHSATKGEVCNLYGKQPRALGNKTLASFQINISNEQSQQYVDKDGRVQRITSPRLINIPRVVRALDRAFEKDLAVTKRQPGWYALKDGGWRLEYRSLPNAVFGHKMNSVSDVVYLASKITAIVEECA